jgi:hypothetical protein
MSADGDFLRSAIGPIAVRRERQHAAVHTQLEGHISPSG